MRAHELGVVERQSLLRPREPNELPSLHLVHVVEALPEEFDVRSRSVHAGVDSVATKKIDVDAVATADEQLEVARRQQVQKLQRDD